MSMHYLGKHEPRNNVFSVRHRHVSSPGECGWLSACGKARGRHFEHLQLTGSVQSHPHSPHSSSEIGTPHTPAQGNAYTVFFIFLPFLFSSYELVRERRTDSADGCGRICCVTSVFELVHRGVQQRNNLLVFQKLSMSLQRGKDTSTINPQLTYLLTYLLTY